MSADVINLYPKSSCFLETCPTSFPLDKTNPPYGASNYRSNLAVVGCRVPEALDCSSHITLNSSVQPLPPATGPSQAEERGQAKQIASMGSTRQQMPSPNWYDLNPQAYLSKVDDGFDQVGCPTGGCPNPNYISLDPRQRDVLRGDYLVLDRPPMNGNVMLKDVYDKKWTDYGQNISDYSTIGDGDITYYVDKSIAPAFYKPVFSEYCQEDTELYQDPMSAIRTQHNRKALINTANPSTTSAVDYPYCLSFIQDSQSFREDLMARQQRRHNEQKWTARWSGGYDY